jgi:hypothetical protein
MGRIFFFPFSPHDPLGLTFDMISSHPLSQPSEHIQHFKYSSLSLNLLSQLPSSSNTSVCHRQHFRRWNDVPTSMNMVWPLYAMLHNRGSRKSDLVVAQDDEQDMGKWWMDPYFRFPVLVILLRCTIPLFYFWYFGHFMRMQRDTVFFAFWLFSFHWCL